MACEKGFLKMECNYDEFTSRNIGIFSYSDQEKIRKGSVSIAGAGGIGGLCAERLARIGVGGIKISDPGLFEVSNFNRQFGADADSIDQNKARVVHRSLKRINNEMNIIFDESGINSQSDADRLVSDSAVVVDAMDYLIRESIFLQRAARKRGIYYLFASAIAFGALMVVFEPGGFTLEEYNGLPKDIDLEDIPVPEVAVEKVFPILPSYVLNPDTMEFLKEITQKKRPASANSIGAGLSSIILANEVVSILLGKKPSVIAPNYFHLDLRDKTIVVR
jgi:molybdopterin/thiamine biosynthesis adenylyltransferase